MPGMVTVAAFLDWINVIDSTYTELLVFLEAAYAMITYAMIT